MKKFILTDGNGNYIRHDKQSNKYVQVNQIGYANTWDSFDKAERIRKCALGKELRRKFYSVTIETPDEPTVQATQRITIPEVIEEVKAVNNESIENAIISFLKCAESLFAKKGELLEKQSNVDKEVSDLQHYIEQKNLNAYEGYMAYKRLQGVLIRRRGIKDELLILNIIEDCKMEPESISHTISRIQGLSGRKYAPRVLTDIFEKGVG